MAEVKQTTYHTHITSKHKLFSLNLKEVWRYRDLIVLFTKRSFTLSYKQTVLGPAWIFINPLISSLVHAFVFGGIAGIGTDGIPTILFYFSSNAIWTFFASCLTSNASTFTANAGEILGIAGISGCGQKELLESIAGLQHARHGKIYYIGDDGEIDDITGHDPLEIAAKGVALSFVPEDRLGMGLVGSMDIIDNMMLRSFRKGNSAFTDRKGPKELAEKVVKELEVSTPNTTTPVSRLSGGNVQKVLVGREIASSPTVLLSAYVVRGLDINSSYTIYDLINKQKKNNVAVIYVGEDLDVLLELCDRILVLCGGKVSGIVDHPTPEDKRKVGMMMTKLGGGEDDEQQQS